MSFENEKYTVERDPYEWCLRQSKVLKAIDPQIQIQMRNHKLLTQIPGELENTIKCRCNQSSTLDDISNTLQDQLSKGKENIYAIEKVPAAATQEEDSESDSMGDAIREISDDDQYPIEEFVVEWREETQLENHYIQLEAGLLQDTPNMNFCKHKPDSQTFLVTATKGMEYIHEAATKMTTCVDNFQHPLIIDIGGHCSIVAIEYLNKHFPNWKTKLLPTKAKNFKSASGKMTSIGTIIKEIIIPHREGNI
ncbi:hypothetical protein O181_025363 [Austropuccinia psidii MF-1]|uniref:Uncharacterized protein n=1 Tax=Austropuccinia psidii MF-1 TaxID=1389203 RepID=A0A9Q3GZ16_9BASI|nr:hypothetical protein [Austropuccinia psidii MF-1]